MMPRAAAPPVVHRTEHTLTVAAPADTLYALVADADRWPAVFAPTVHVHHLSRSARNERFEIWAMVGEEVAHWRSSRILDPQRRYVYFRQEHSRPPVTSMSGGWLVRPLPNGHSEVVLRHRFTVQDDDPAAVDALQEALDRNSERELGALAALTRTGHPADELVFSFTDTVTSPCAPEEAYAFIERADRWPELLPHVARVRLDEPAEGVQHLEMDTVTADGSAHTTRSVRICRAPEWIAYKQQRTPRLLAGHAGLWTFARTPDGTAATARHTVVLDPACIGAELGTHATLRDARAHVRELLRRNSAATLRHALEHALRG
ncbi:aromatase/cyclase [Streptomyces thermoviolaceus]|nr:aromatase/cyclase [Streptomyces thermoviolaceus]MCM3264786.1 aromatase/cyclase [Streptomyces thermoviolaceus]WTD48898.1 aromatase/cyclase [Streptomyces thermoviolaceus]GHB08727.1 actinorhodin polyketide synthase bifunctional cyclase/dehydratase [Streptomyces thermoviolaceus subsp. thermoviolaceus]